jgi:hypothetical protein
MIKSIYFFTLLAGTLQFVSAQTPNEDFKQFVSEKQYSTHDRSIPESDFCDTTYTIPREVIVCDWNLKPFPSHLYLPDIQEYVISDANINYLDSMYSTTTLQKQDQAKLANNLIIFPSPSVNYIHLNFTQNDNFTDLTSITCEVFDMNGNLSLSVTSEAGKLIDISALPTGMYAVKVTNTKQEIFYSKLVKQ